MYKVDVPITAVYEKLELDQRELQLRRIGWSKQLYTCHVVTEINLFCITQTFTTLGDYSLDTALLIRIHRQNISVPLIM